MSRIRRLAGPDPLARAVSVALICAVGAATSCGIGTDEGPRDLAASSATSTSTTEVTGAGDKTAQAVLYFVQGEKLVPIRRAVQARTDQGVLDSLLQSPTAEEGPQLSSSIPSGTRLLRLSQGGTLLSVDLSKEFNDVVGPRRQQAVGQIVLSETELEGVEELAFSIDGKPFKVTTSRGDVDVVSACDYASMLADPSAEDVELTTGQITLLELTKDGLEKCP